MYTNNQAPQARPSCRRQGIEEWRGSVVPAPPPQQAYTPGRSQELSLGNRLFFLTLPNEVSW